MATIKELLSAMIDKINGNEDKIDNIKGVPEAFDSITMTNGTEVANLTMSADKELLLEGKAVGGSGGGCGVVYIPILVDPDGGVPYCEKTVEEVYALTKTNHVVFTMETEGAGITYYHIRRVFGDNNYKGLVFGNIQSYSPHGDSVSITEIVYTNETGYDTFSMTVNGNIDLDENWMA